METLREQQAREWQEHIAEYGDYHADKSPRWLEYQERHWKSPLAHWLLYQRYKQEYNND